jgi:hypothetical protein
MQSKLTTTSGTTGDQASTQSPQPATQSNLSSSADSSSVQPGSPLNLLSTSSSTSVSLYQTQLPSVSFTGSGSTGYIAKHTTTTAEKHHVSGVLITILDDISFRKKHNGLVVFGYCLEAK